MKEGQTWGSLVSMREDIFAATGTRFTLAEVRGAVRSLHRERYVLASFDPFPETRGRYGLVYTLSPEAYKPVETMDAVREYRILHYGDPEQFTYGEVVVGTLGNGAKRGRTGQIPEWAEKVAQLGLNDAAFTNIGRWRKGEVKDVLAPVYVPYFTLDIDRDVLAEAFDDAQSIAEVLLDEGFSLHDTFVSFSGRRGFHVQISATQFGSPIFKDTDAAKMMNEEIAAYLGRDIKLDPSVNSPLNLIRLVGSKHEKTGLFKTGWTLGDFIKLDFEQAMEQVHTGIPISMMPQGETDQDVLDAFDYLLDVADERYRAYLAMPKRIGPGGPGEVINALIHGVSESDNWHERHAGRNMAGFILAMWLTEGNRTGDDQIDQLINTTEKMHVWNLRNNPPMPDREITSLIRSAERRAK